MVMSPFATLPLPLQRSKRWSGVLVSWGSAPLVQSPVQRAFGGAAEVGGGDAAHVEIAGEVDGAGAPVFFQQLREFGSAGATQLHCRVVAGGGGEIDRAGGVERAAERAAIERAHFEIAIAQGEIGGGVGDFERSQAEMSDVDGAVEERPILAAGADAVDELLHHALVFAAQRSGERAEVDVCGGEVEAGAGRRRGRAAACAGCR